MIDDMTWTARHRTRKNSTYYVILIIIIMVGMCAIWMRFSENNGIITVPGWEHGVVICGEAVVINHGHERDYEYRELIDLADVFCPKSK